ncbi:CPBP family intramembrane glutamic endopeptidase [uncultured Clostridium sp.]|uniref:CPBP family intramembrane glutamic endopeptidase n=1 Tax=uncultured Clostridium sp. TaxID=59620 RepID=UPI003216BE6D
MIKDKPILKSIIWTFVILIFPVVSGVITQVLMMNNIQTMFIQGCFMLISLIIPIVYMWKFKISFKKIGLIIIENGSAKKVLFFLPLVIAEAPFLLVGIRLNSIKYIITLLFFTIAVGISEEIYFRGIILKLLEEKYPKKKSIIISALVFGIIAAEIVTITKSLIPIIIWHFVFNFVNYITLATGVNEIFVIGFQEIIMIIYAYNLWSKISLKNKDIVQL